MSKSPQLRAPSKAQEVPQCTLAELLEGVSLHAERKVSSLFTPNSNQGLAYPDNIRVYCPDCEGERRRHYRQSDTAAAVNIAGVFYHYISYICTNCLTTRKTYGLRCVHTLLFSGLCAKIYEEPTFGEPIPKKLYQFIGEENREHFLNARRSIARSLGIGAYAYYRRIVENGKFSLVSAILEVAEATGAAPEQIAQLKRAAQETQFTRAIDLVGDAAAIPASLLIDGHNPLAVLHDQLSEGIHQLTDAECLKRAQYAEIILTETAIRLQNAVTEKSILKEALSSVVNRKSATAQNIPKAVAAGSETGQPKHSG